MFGLSMRELIIWGGVAFVAYKLFGDKLGLGSLADIWAKVQEWINSLVGGLFKSTTTTVETKSTFCTVDIVKSWRTLRSEAMAAGALEAVQHLDDMFIMLNLEEKVKHEGQ